MSDLRNIIEELRVSKYGNTNEVSARETSPSIEGEDKEKDDAVHVAVRSSLRAAIQAAALEHHVLQQQHQSHSPSQSLSLSSQSAPKVPTPLVVVCGTAFVMAEARVELGILEPRDSESLSDPLSSADLADFNRNIDAQVQLQNYSVCSDFRR